VARTIVIPGGSGFLGRTLAKWFSKQGDQVIILSRTDQAIENARVVLWDAKSLGPWTKELEASDLIINLTGRSVNCRYNNENQAQMINSRVDSTLVLGKAIAQCNTPPPVWMNSSTATIYRHRYDAPNDEFNGLYGSEKEAKDAFSLEVAHAWEDAFQQAYKDNNLRNTRGIILRSAMIFGNEPGGVYETLRKLTKLHLGGMMGHGRQYVSWMHATDFCRSLDWLYDNKNAEGIYNLCSPKPVPNAQMMAELRQTLNVGFGLPAPKPLLEIGAFFMRTETELIVKSRRVVPTRLLNEGFSFVHANLRDALQELN